MTTLRRPDALLVACRGTPNGLGLLSFQTFVRGPIVYCVESADNPGIVRQLTVPPQATCKASHQPDLLNGVIVVTGTLRIIKAPTWNQFLYAAARDLPDYKTAELTAVPYYANANRRPVELAVWLPEA